MEMIYTNFKVVVIFTEEREGRKWELGFIYLCLNCQSSENSTEQTKTKINVTNQCFLKISHGHMDVSLLSFGKIKK